MDDKNIISITLSDDGKSYKVVVDKGMSLNEVMFAMSVAIKCFVRDGYIEKPEIATELLNKYLTDEQYNEIKEEENNDSI